MKKILSVFFCAVVFAFSACANSEQTSRLPELMYGVSMGMSESDVTNTLKEKGFSDIVLYEGTVMLHSVSDYMGYDTDFVLYDFTDGVCSAFDVTFSNYSESMFSSLQKGLENKLGSPTETKSEQNHMMVIWKNVDDDYQVALQAIVSVFDDGWQLAILINKPHI